MRQVRIGEQLVAYEQFGRGPHLVILHGWAGRGAEWRGVGEVLARRYRITLVDLPGFGNSSVPPETWSMPEYADFVETFLQYLKINKATLLGHSFGGRIAIILGARGTVATQLILVDAAGVEMKSVKVRAYQRMLKILPGEVMRKIIPQKMRAHFWSEDYAAAGAMRQVFRTVISQPLRELLGQIHVPTLIIWGEKDVVLPFAEAKYIHAHIPCSRLRVVWGASHWPHIEKPDELLQVLEEEHV